MSRFYDVSLSVPELRRFTKIGAVNSFMTASTITYKQANKIGSEISFIGVKFHS